MNFWKTTLNFTIKSCCCRTKSTLINLNCSEKTKAVTKSEIAFFKEIFFLETTFLERTNSV